MRHKAGLMRHMGLQTIKSVPYAALCGGLLSRPCTALMRSHPVKVPTAGISQLSVVKCKCVRICVVSVVSTYMYVYVYMYMYMYMHMYMYMYM